LPDNFPASSLAAQRFLTVLKLKDQEKMIQASYALWKAYWSNNKTFSEEDIIECLKPLFGESVLNIIEISKTTEIKEELSRTTNEAIATGAFGAPWIVCEKEGSGGTETATFFGSDRFENVAHWLNVKYGGPVPKIGKM
jgi:glutathione S-transferase kappa 1